MSVPHDPDTCQAQIAQLKYEIETFEEALANWNEDKAAQLNYTNVKKELELAKHTIIAQEEELQTLRNQVADLERNAQAPQQDGSSDAGDTDVRKQTPRNRAATPVHLPTTSQSAAPALSAKVQALLAATAQSGNTRARQASFTISNRPSASQVLKRKASDPQELPGRKIARQHASMPELLDSGDVGIGPASEQENEASVLPSSGPEAGGSVATLSEKELDRLLGKYHFSRLEGNPTCSNTHCGKNGHMNSTCPVRLGIWPALKGRNKGLYVNEEGIWLKARTHYMPARQCSLYLAFGKAFVEDWKNNTSTNAGMPAKEQGCFNDVTKIWQQSTRQDPKTQGSRPNPKPNLRTNPALHASVSTPAAMPPADQPAIRQSFFAQQQPPIHNTFGTGRIPLRPDGQPPSYTQPQGGGGSPSRSNTGQIPLRPDGRPPSYPSYTQFQGDGGYIQLQGGGTSPSRSSSSVIPGQVFMKRQEGGAYTYWQQMHPSDGRPSYLVQVDPPEGVIYGREPSAHTYGH